MLRDEGPLQSREGEVPGSGIDVQSVQPVCLRRIGLQPFLHQEVLHAVREQTLGPVPSADSDGAREEEAPEHQGGRLVTQEVQKHKVPSSCLENTV